MSITATLSVWARHIQFSQKAQVAFLEDLASLINDGVPVPKAIETMALLSTDATKAVAESANLAISQGQMLADGLDGWFPIAILEILRAGESGGSLVSAIHAAAASIGRRKQLTNLFFNVLLYPVIVFCLACGITVFIKHSVLDTFLTIKPLVVWPATGQNLYQFATFIEHQSIWTLGWIASIAVGCLFLLRNLTGAWRHTLDALPILSLYRDFTAARLMQTLGLLMQNGIIMKNALALLQNHATPYLQAHLVMMEARLSSGMENIAAVLDTDLIRENDLTRLKIIAQGRGFASALCSMGELARTRTEQFLKTLFNVLSGLLFVASGAIAVTIIFGIYAVGQTLAT